MTDPCVCPGIPWSQIIFWCLVAFSCVSLLAGTLFLKRFLSSKTIQFVNRVPKVKDKKNAPECPDYRLPIACLFLLTLAIGIGFVFYLVTG